MTKWTTALPAHLHTWYWLYWLWRLNRSLCSMRKILTTISQGTTTTSAVMVLALVSWSGIFNLHFNPSWLLASTDPVSKRGWPLTSCRHRKDFSGDCEVDTILYYDWFIIANDNCFVIFCRISTFCVIFWEHIHGFMWIFFVCGSDLHNCLFMIGTHW